jgi:molecular chaperone GrpE
MNTNPDKNEENSENKVETLAERSARLEAEANEIYVKKDLLAPEDTEGDLYESDIILELRAEVETMRDQMLRAAADAENTKRRALKERDDAKKYSIASFSRDLLSVADNLRRALEAFPDDAAQDIRIANLVEGIAATERELLRSFERNGIVKMSLEGKMFDPNFHEVMFEAAIPGAVGGSIVQVIMDGYMLHDRLLRPAQVGVAKADGTSSSPSKPTEPGHRIDTEA